MSFWHKKTEEEKQAEELKKEEARKKKEEEHKKHHEEGGSGIFTADGKELPKIKGGWDIIDPDSGFGDDFTS